MASKITRLARETGAHALVFVAYVATAIFAMRVVSLPPTNVTAIWLPGGVALVAMVGWLGWRILPTIWLASWAVVALANNYDFLSYRPYSLAIGTVSVAGLAMTYALWRKWLANGPFTSPRSLVVFVFGVALLPSLLTAWMIVYIIFMAGYLPGLTLGEFGLRSGCIVVSNALGIYLVVPLFHDSARWVSGPRNKRYLLYAGCALGGLLVGWLGFTVNSPLFFLSIPLAMISSSMVDAKGSTWAVLVLTLYALGATAHGNGPFVSMGEIAQMPVFAVALFAFGLGISGQFAGLAVRDLRRARDRLEEVVAERTGDLRQSEERYRLALSAVDDGLFDWDVESGETYYNPALYRSLEFAPGEFPPTYGNFLRLVEPRERRSVHRLVEACVLRQRDSFDFEVRLRTRLGHYRWLRVRGRVAARGNGGRARRIVGTMMNVTEAKRQALDLAAARDAAQAADRAKSEFLAAMSHEIRTPMNGVLGFARLLAECPHDARQQEYIDAILVSGQVLLALLNDILDLSKIEAGAVELEDSPFAVRELIGDTLQLFRANAEEKGLTLGLAIDENVSEALSGDAVRLSQVLSNLVSNAIKFTDHGGVNVRVSSRLATIKDGQNYHETTLAIRDTGIGISAEQMKRLFTSFSQADASITRRFGGTGLGLTISRRLCEHMGGGIQVTSELGKGSVFRATFVLAEYGERVDRASRKPFATPPPFLPSGGLMILVAEDNRLNRRLIEALLSRLGHRFVFAVNGQEAVEQWAEGNFDLIIMDVQMPVMDGRTAAKTIRRREADSARRRTPIVAATADAMPDDRQKCLAAGMDDYLPKPLDAQRFADTIAKLVART